ADPKDRQAAKDDVASTVEDDPLERVGDGEAGHRPVTRRDVKAVSGRERATIEDGSARPTHDDPVGRGTRDTGSEAGMVRPVGKAEVVAWLGIPKGVGQLRGAG